MVRLGRRIRGVLHVLRDFLNRCGHLGNGSSRLIGFIAQTIQRLRLRTGKFRGQPCLGLYTHPCIDQSGQRRLQTCFFTEHGQIQLPLNAGVVAVSESYQLTGKGFRMFSQGALDGSALTALDHVPGSHQTPRHQRQRLRLCKPENTRQ
ncbi:hypothetical protein D3C86_1578210 [compost metagenome]